MMNKNVSFSSLIHEGALRYGLSLEPVTLSLFQRYYEHLSEWNARVNLISESDLGRFVEYHILDALKVASVFDFSGVHTMMDLGSGSGIPGIPFAIAFPAIETTLVEPRVKRFAFLKSACAFIPVPNACAIQSRIESFDHSFLGSFDVIITRATVNLSDFFRFASSFLSDRGSLISIKGETISDELSALNDELDRKAFSLTTATPIFVRNVRSGNVIIISRR